MIMQLSELERKAYREGDTEKAEIIAQLMTHCKPWRI